MFVLIAVLSVSGCTGLDAGLNEPNQSQAAESATTADSVGLTEQQIAEGFEYWPGSKEFIYRWATGEERTGIPCYSKFCTYIQVEAAETCRSIAYDWDELDSSGNVLSQQSSGLSNIQEPESDFAPGIGFVLSDMSQTDSFKLTSMTCSEGDYDWSLQKVGNSDQVEEAPAEASKVELPNFIGSSTKGAEDWIRSNGYSYRVNASTKLGMNYVVSCRINNQDTILTQRPSPGSLVADNSSTTVWFEINC